MTKTAAKADHPVTGARRVHQYSRSTPRNTIHCKPEAMAQGSIEIIKRNSLKLWGLSLNGLVTDNQSPRIGSQYKSVGACM